MGEYSYTMTTSIVGTDDGRETYEISRTFDVEGKSAVLIALYPTVSLLNPIKMDSSTMYLLNHTHKLGYNDIRIVNLFSKVFERKPSLKQLRESQDTWIIRPVKIDTILGSKMYCKTQHIVI